ncbi:MAG: amino acid ABC transporter permease [Faecalibacterium sp.]
MDSLFDASAWAKVWTFRATFILGLETTVLTALVALLMALALGVIFGLCATGKIKLLRVLSRVYVELIQNTPLLLQLCFLYYALAFSGRSLGIMMTGMVALGIYHGAYISEVVRAGIQAVPVGQMEAAKSQGFGYLHSMLYIILPQSVKMILPPLVNQMVNLIKNTSCLYLVGGTDLISLTYSFVTGVSTGGAYGPAYLVSGVLFFIICFPLSTLAGYWEHRLKTADTRTVAQPTQPAAEQEGGA